MNNDTGHRRYLKQLLHHGSVYLGAISFVLVLVLPVFLEISDYVSFVLYFGGVAAFYWAGYKTWKESLPLEESEPLVLKADRGTVTFVSGTGSIFRKSKLLFRLSVTNNSDKAVALDNVAVNLKKDSPWLKLKGRPKLIWGSGESVGSCAEIGPKESKILDVNLEGEGGIEDRIKLAKALREDPIVGATLTAEYFLEGERTAIEVNFEYDAEKLIDHMRSSWSRSSLRDAIKELEQSA
ncbi:hypothetical protein HOP52_17890 [Halomonas campisalis]|uniref:DUF58 domain-containing protein n=1 Tax=Billgrantia campisalis TaxID=74661 RepID=A0ABS9PES6_9GAMM|nr:hypothetical protein [Halomonas campisalis]MCG6659625.1 hypothetical protein [Halomonas campisalis]MDR5865104.1 hypothetical protein [Halomonas campisalis]